MRMFLMVLLGASLTTGREPSPVPTRSPCRVSRVIDGDTFSCTGGRMIRLLSIDAPEGRQHPAGDSATATLQRLIHRNVRVSLELGRDSLDRYGRTLAFAWLEDGRLVNEEMVRRGWAVVYLYDNKNSQYDERLLDAEASARRSDTGWWHSGRIRCRPKAFRHHECTSGA